MKNIIGIVLIVLGVFLFIQGLNRRNSVVGGAATIGKDVANAVDGGTRQPKHVILMVAGGVVALIGVGAMLRKPASV